LSAYHASLSPHPAWIFPCTFCHLQPSARISPTAQPLQGSGSLSPRHDTTGLEPITRAPHRTPPLGHGILSCARWPPRAGFRSCGWLAVPAAAARFRPCTARLPSAIPGLRYAVHALLPEARGLRSSWLLHRLIALTVAPTVVPVVAPTKGPPPESSQEHLPSTETIRLRRI